MDLFKKEERKLYPEELLPFCTCCLGVGISDDDDGGNFCHMCGSGGGCISVKRKHIKFLEEQIREKVDYAKTYTQEECKKDTIQHINQVREFMMQSANELLQRGIKHDQSKLQHPELHIFTQYTPKLKDSTYGSKEYKEFLKEMQVALDHHYAKNSHHPEHWSNGINGMDLFDLIEMICDWKAAVMRHDNGDINKSLEINKKRFNINNQLYEILKNTVERFK